MNGALVAAFFRAHKSAKGGIRLGNGPMDGEDSTFEDKSPGQAVDNPLANVDIPRKHLVAMFVVAIVGSTISSFVFTVGFFCNLSSRDADSSFS